MTMIIIINIIIIIRININTIIIVVVIVTFIIINRSSPHFVNHIFIVHLFLRIYYYLHY
jgi:hypothetical protein